MSREQLESPLPLTGAEGACVVCGDSVSGSRCDHCGAAVAPGGWKILRQLAKGPHSRVFLAERDGQRVALKELLFALVPEAAQLDGFEREARLLSQLSHPAIPSLVAFFKEGQGVHTRLYLAQQFVPGRSLLDELSMHRFDEREARAIARELLGVLRYLHGLSPRVIHRDLKPANVMRRDDGRLALVDFGSARDLVRGVTHGSTLVGTFGYMPPEQLGGTVDVTADLYALGATLLHLLSRRPPDELFKPGMELAFEQQINASPGFEAWLKRMVARERQARFQSAEAALEALETSERPAVAAPARPASSRALFAAAAGVIALVGLGSFAVLMRGKEPAPVPPTVRVTQPSLAPAPPVPPAPSRLPPKPVAAKAVVSKPAPSSEQLPGPQVVTVPKLGPLQPFTLDKPFSVKVAGEIPLPDHNAAGASCGAEPSVVHLISVGADPGNPADLNFVAGVTNHGGARGCDSVFVEVLDQNGHRVAATQLTGKDAVGSTRWLKQSESLPKVGTEFQLRFGPQAKPLATYAIDLANQTVTRR